MILSILTPTFNHPDHLKILYKSLIMQEDLDFEWVIVDDGSSDETKLTVDSFLADNIIRIRYKHQENAGKSVAVNTGLDLVSNSDFMVIVDDDEELYTNAITIIKKYYSQYKDQDIACVHFNRSDKNGKIISNQQVITDQLMSLQKHKRLKIKTDGYGAFFVQKVGSLRFPQYINERYVGPSVLIMMSSVNRPVLWAAGVLGKTEYLENGITKKGRRLRLHNPKGMIKHASLFMHPDSGLKLRLGYSIRAYAYKYYNNIKEADLQKENLSMKHFYSVGLLGMILSMYWKYKYSNNQ